VTNYVTTLHGNLLLNGLLCYQLDLHSVYVFIESRLFYFI